jgi:hypothetical protein
MPMGGNMTAVDALFDRFPGSSPGSLLGPIFGLLAFLGIAGGLAYIVISFRADATVGLVSLIVVPLVLFVWLGLVRVAMDAAAALFEVRDALSKTSPVVGPGAAQVASSPSEAFLASGTGQRPVTPSTAGKASTLDLNRNEHAVFDVIWRGKSVDRAAIQEAVDMSPETLTEVLESLKERGIIWLKGDLFLPGV